MHATSAEHISCRISSWQWNSVISSMIWYIGLCRRSFFLKNSSCVKWNCIIFQSSPSNFGIAFNRIKLSEKMSQSFREVIRNDESLLEILKMSESRSISSRSVVNVSDVGGLWWLVFIHILQCFQSNFYAQINNG